MLYSIFHDVLKILFPGICAGCGILGEPLCVKCYRRLEFCPHLRDVIGEGDVDSETGEVKGLQVCSGMYYQADSVLERLIHPFKYKHQAGIFRVFVPHMIEAVRLLAEPAELVLVPVPLHRKRFLERGYNQAELLAQWVARCVGCQMADMLERVRDTGHQARRATRAARKESMSGAFRVKGSFAEVTAARNKRLREFLKSSHFVLVDDIVTSGSTLLACRDALRAAGAKKISALTLADRERSPENPWD
jgi:ComF family protein